MSRSTTLPTLTFFLCGVLRAAAASHGVPVTADQVASAIQDTGVDVSPRQVVMLTTVIAKSGVPSLKVQSVAPWSAHQNIVRLTCDRSNECLPFYVAVNLENADDKAKRPSSNQLESNSAPTSAHAPTAIKSGSPARLYIDSGRIHIQLSVTALTGGAVGETVKAQTADHKVYWAKVVDGETLRGQL